MLRFEPVPTGHGIVSLELLGVRNQESDLFSKLVHARSNGEIIRALRATVKHDDQRPPCGNRSRSRHVELVPEPSRCGDEQPGTIVCAFGYLGDSMRSDSPMPEF